MTKAPADLSVIFEGSGDKRESRLVFDRLEGTVSGKYKGDVVKKGKFSAVGSFDRDTHHVSMTVTLEFTY